MFQVVLQTTELCPITDGIQGSSYRWLTEPMADEKQARQAARYLSRVVSADPEWSNVQLRRVPLKDGEVWGLGSSVDFFGVRGGFLPAVPPKRPDFPGYIRGWKVVGTVPSKLPQGTILCRTHGARAGWLANTAPAGWAPMEDWSWSCEPCHTCEVEADARRVEREKYSPQCQTCNDRGFMSFDCPHCGR